MIAQEESLRSRKFYLDLANRLTRGASHRQVQSRGLQALPPVLGLGNFVRSHHLGPHRPR